MDDFEATQPIGDLLHLYGELELIDPPAMPDEVRERLAGVVARHNSGTPEDGNGRTPTDTD